MVKSVSFLLKNADEAKMEHETDEINAERPQISGVAESCLILHLEKDDEATNAVTCPSTSSVDHYKYYHRSIIPHGTPH